VSEFPAPLRVNAFSQITQADVEHSAQLVRICSDLFLSEVHIVAEKYRAAVSAIISGVVENIPLDRPRPRTKSFEYGLLDILDDLDKQIYNLTHDIAADIEGAIEDQL
jgi:hypothetical protein